MDSWKESTQLTAKDIISRSPVFVDVEDNIEEVVWTMVQDDLYMVLALEGENLARILTRRVSSGSSRRNCDVMLAAVLLGVGFSLTVPDIAQIGTLRGWLLS